MATEYIRVYTRIKPSDADTKVLVTNGNCLEVKTLTNVNSFAYDGILSEDCSQVDVFNCVGRRIVESCVDGYNGTIFAYGQTGSGKTHTMMGQSGSLSYLYNDLQKGIVPRSAELLVDLLDRKKRELNTFHFEISVSFVELYNEIIYDLLCEDQKQILLRADDKVVTLIDVTKEMVTSDVDIMRTVEIGLTRRSKAATAMNIESSRSHAIFIIEVTMEEECGGVINRKRCTLNLVDLAGSERQSQSLATGARLKEAGNINQSLTVLGRVIRTLTQDKDSFIPYRDSKLTHILKDSLGGNSRTAVIASVHPDQTYYAETISTLRFAQQCKMVKNKASANREVSGESVDSLKKEISRLISLKDEEYIAHKQTVEELENALRETQIEVDNLQQVIKGLKRELEQNQGDASELRAQMRKVCVDSFADVTNNVEFNNSQVQLTPKQRKERRRTRYTLSSQKDTLQRHQEKKGVSIIWGDEEIATEETNTNKENKTDELTATLMENNSKLVKENQELSKQCKDFSLEKKALEDLFATTSDKLKASADMENILSKQLEEKAGNEAKLQNDIDELNQEVMEYKAKMEVMRSEFEKESEFSKKELEAYKTEVKMVESKMAAAMEEIEAMKVMSEKKQAAEMKYKKEIKHMLKELDSYRRSLEMSQMKADEDRRLHDEMMSMLMKESEQSRENLEKRVASLDKELSVQRNYANQYKEERVQTESFAERQKEELRRRDKDCQRLQEENNSLTVKLKEMFHSFTEEIKELTKNNDEKLESLVETERQREDAICKKNSMEAKLSLLESELVAERLKSERMEKELIETKSNNDLLTAQHHADLDKLGSVFGHTNNKQKIKEFIKIKAENTELKKKVSAFEVQLEKLGVEAPVEGKVTRSRAKAAAHPGS